MKNMLLNFRRWGISNAPSIALVAGASLAVSSVILAINATPKAIKAKEALANAYEIEPEELTKKEVVKEVYKYYIPSALTLTASMICFFGANNSFLKRNLTLASALKLSEKTYREYRDSVIDTMGEVKHKEIRKRVAEKSAEKTLQNVDISGGVDYATGDIWCLDYYSGQMFKSNRMSIEKAINSLNYDLNRWDTVSLNNFYELFPGLKNTGSGEVLGWNSSEGLIELDAHAQMSEQGDPILVVGFSPEPTSAYTDRKWR